METTVFTETPLAKSSGLDLRSHMEDTLKAAAILWDSLSGSVRERIGAGTSGGTDPFLLALFLASVHDIGKATPGFQRRLAGGPSGNLRHSAVSQAILEDMGLDRSVALIVGSHHGFSPTIRDIKRVFAYPEETGFGDPRWFGMQTAFIDYCCAMSETSLEGLRNVTLEPAVQVLLSGFVVIADRMASGGYLEVPQRWVPLQEFSFRDMFGKDPRPFQIHARESARRMSEPGLLVLEAPMGEGKTEAALAAAGTLISRFGLGGIVYALPTRASSETMLARLSGYMERQGLHVGIFGGRNASVLCSRFTVCVVDQVLQMALKQRYLAVRHLALAGNVVVLDECHAYDAYMGSYLYRTLEWLGAYHVPVILMSATLPSQERMRLIGAYTGSREQTVSRSVSAGYPLIIRSERSGISWETVVASGSSRDVRIERCSVSDLPNILSGTSCESVVGVFVNTVGRAQEVYDAVTSALPSRDVMLIHSGFASCDRIGKEERLLVMAGPHRSGQGAVVIGTQVIEQSLDLDFDIIFTELCPVDLILQRIGRLHRHPRRRPVGTEVPVCHIMDTSGEPDVGSVNVYGMYHLLTARQILGDRVSIPGDIPRLIGEAYGGKTDISDGIRREAERVLRAKARDAEVFQTVSPGLLRDISGWTEDPVSKMPGGFLCRSAVRDSDPSVEVIPVVRDGTGYRMLPWVGGGRRIPEGALSDDTVDSLLGCMLRLPHAVLFKNPRKVIRTMLDQNRSEIPKEWGTSPRLERELFLILDPGLGCTLPGFRLEYTKERGLRVYDRT